MYKLKHFIVEELVPPQVYQDRGAKALQLFDTNLLKLIDYLRDNLGPMIINNWKWKGDRQWSGLRTPDSPYYSKYSQHSFGRAFDCIFQLYTAQEVRGWLKNNTDKVCEDVGIHGFTVEEGVGWLHIDLRNSGKGYNSFYP